jgi:four helix bundle protein
MFMVAREQARKIFVVSKSFPKEERFSLTDQIRRSSRAVNAMIAEAWARRRYPAAFINKIDEAMGEAMETQAWLDHALDCNYLDRNQHRALDEMWQKVGAMLNRMIHATTLQIGWSLTAAFPPSLSPSRSFDLNLFHPPSPSSIPIPGGISQPLIWD